MVLIGLVTTVVTTLLLAVTTGSTSVALLGIEALVTTVAALLVATLLAAIATTVTTLGTATVAGATVTTAVALVETTTLLVAALLLVTTAVAGVVTATVATATRATRVGHVDSDTTAVKLLLVHSGNGSLSLLRGTVGNKTETSGSASLTVLHNDAVGDGTVGGKDLEKGVIGGVPRKIAYQNHSQVTRIKSIVMFMHRSRTTLALSAAADCYTAPRLPLSNMTEERWMNPRTMHVVALPNIE